MDSRTRTRVEEWESRPFGGGSDELESLADQEFSGALTAAGIWIFVLNGRVVGTVGGGPEDVVGVSGTVYEAPEDVLPLLAAMVESDGESKGTYYTNETSLTEVDHTLQQGSFTGYVELAEQVLSGDYYTVYYGGRRMSAAYIGNAERLLTGEDAFERAADEVGIYEVVEVDVPVQDLTGSGNPDGTLDEDSPSVTGGALADDSEDETSDGDERAGDSDEAPSDRSEGITTSGDGIRDSDVEPVEDDRAAADSADDATPVGPEATDAEGDSDSRTDRVSYDETAATEAADASEETAQGDGKPTHDETAPDEASAPSDGTAPTTGADTSAGTGAAATDESDPVEHPDRTDSRRDDADASPADAEAGPVDERFEEEARWRETRRIPSIDPDASSDEEYESSRGRSTAGRPSAADERPSDSRREEAPHRERSPEPDPSSVASTTRALQSDMLEREDKIDQLIQRVTQLEGEKNALEEMRGDLAAENEELMETIDQLRARIERLEGDPEGRAVSDQVETSSSDQGRTDAETDHEAPTPADARSMAPADALEATNLFVRYHSKSRPTLERAHDGDCDQRELIENLELECHTPFDAAATVVDGRPYRAFLEATIQYRFSRWLVETALFEIRDTGHAGGLGDLYDVLPRIDRIELDASISLEDDDTEDVPESVRFDVVAFDKRGTPLVVATCNESRDPTTGETLESLEVDASAVCANYPDLAAAVAVTASFFDPDALDLAERATSSGILSRSSKLSYVSLARKQGYHLCLIESRNDKFHMTVPEL